MPPDLLVLSASNGENLRLSERFAASGRARGMETEVIDLTTLSLPLYNPRTHAESGLPAAVAELSQRLGEAPRWVICAPEYNGSLPPVLTSTIAWLSVQGDEFRTLFNGRPIAIATHSGGPGIEVMTVLRIQLAHLGAHVVGRQLTSNRNNPAKDSSIDDIVHRLQRMEPIHI